MNRRYIDFVPNSNPDSTQVIMPKRRVFRAETVETVTDVRAKASVKAGGRTQSKAIDDVKVAKSKRVSAKPSEVVGRGMIKTATEKPLKSEKPVKKTKPIIDKKEENKILETAARKADNLDQSFKTPQTHFVNTEKVVKRPLSKNVYQKKIVEPKEEPQAPVTIIHKPEKDSKMSLVVTIIITIILGAAAGTVAFLLLPK